MWYLHGLTVVRKELNLPQENVSVKKINKIHPVNQKVLQDFVQQLELKAYNENPLMLYVAEFTHLLQLMIPSIRILYLSTNVTITL